MISKEKLLTWCISHIYTMLYFLSATLRDSAFRKNWEFTAAEMFVEFHVSQYKNLTKEELYLLNGILEKLSRPWYYLFNRKPCWCLPFLHIGKKNYTPGIISFPIQANSISNYININMLWSFGNFCNGTYLAHSNLIGFEIGCCRGESIFNTEDILKNPGGIYMPKHYIDRLNK